MELHSSVDAAHGRRLGENDRMRKRSFKDSTERTCSQRGNSWNTYGGSGAHYQFAPLNTRLDQPGRLGGANTESLPDWRVKWMVASWEVWTIDDMSLETVAYRARNAQPISAHLDTADQVDSLIGNTERGRCCPDSRLSSPPEMVA